MMIIFRGQFRVGVPLTRIAVVSGRALAYPWPTSSPPAATTAEWTTRARRRSRR